MKNRHTLIALALVLFSIHSSAQTLDWIQTVESPEISSNGLDQFDISVNDFGEALVMGPFENLAYYNDTYGTLKLQLYSETGSILSTETFEGRGRVIDMVSHGDYFYVAGEYLDSIQFQGISLVSFADPSPIGGFIFKMHRNGELIWVQETLEILSEMTIYSMDVHTNGTLYVGAGTFSGNSKILRMNGSGEIIDSWYQTNVGIVSSISVNESGEVAVAGSCAHDLIDFNGTTVQAPIESYNIFVARYDSEGSYLWSHFMEDVTCPQPVVLLKDDGTTFFAGDLNIETTLGDFELQPLGWVYSLFHASISSEGEVLWAYQPTQPENGLGDAFLARGHSIIDWGNDVIVGGFTRGSLLWGEGVTSNSSVPGESLFMSHFQADGHVENLIIGDEANHNQSVLSMADGPNGTLYMIGLVYDTLNVQGQSLFGEGFQLFVSRWNGDIVQSTEKISAYNLRHYPDPANDNFVIEGAQDGDRLGVYDILGRPVYSSTIKGSKSFDVSHFPAGTYFIQIISKEIPVYRSSIRVSH